MKRKDIILDEDGLKCHCLIILLQQNNFCYSDINSLIEDDLFLITNRIYNDEFLKKLIVQIDVTDSELLMLTRIGEQIEFGKIKDINDKFKKLILYYEKGNTQNKEYITLNLKYKNQIVCTKK